MGMCFPCFKNSSTDFHTPDIDTRRRQQVEAAERRQKEQEGRGIKDPERVKRQQQKMEELERRQVEAATHNDTEGGLRWQMN